MSVLHSFEVAFSPKFSSVCELVGRHLGLEVRESAQGFTVFEKVLNARLMTVDAPSWDSERKSPGQTAAQQAAGIRTPSDYGTWIT